MGTRLAQSFPRTVYCRVGATGFAEASSALAANQGLYNGFLAAGLIWGLVRQGDVPVRVFFLICVVVAGIFGALTVKPTILLVQAAPAVIALVLVGLSRSRSRTG